MKTKVKIYHLIIFLLLLISCNKNSQEPISIIETFFLTYEKSGTDKALDNIFQTNDWILKNSIEDIENLKNKLNSHVSFIGNYQGYEFIAKRSIGESLKHFTCLVKYDKQPLRFSFTFYNGKDSWVLYDFKFDNTLTEEIDEAAKFYYID